VINEETIGKRKYYLSQLLFQINPVFIKSLLIRSSSWKKKNKDENL